MDDFDKKLDNIENRIAHFESLGKIPEEERAKLNLELDEIEMQLTKNITCKIIHAMRIV